jgi:hypothetical protein
LTHQDRSKKSRLSSQEEKEEEDANTTFMLSAKRKVTVRKWKNVILIDFREYFTNEAGELLPTKKGISISLDQWNKLKEYLVDIDDTIKRLQNE